MESTFISPSLSPGSTTSLFHSHDRSQFQRDYDRLIFSSPFRRLQNKTQVFPLPGNIFVHNRLTHSLEVASVGRSLGNKVSQFLKQQQVEIENPEILEEIGTIVSTGCLAHDLGNPPFGHSGEEAISYFFSEGEGLYFKKLLSDEEWNDLSHFEGNANTFRLLTHSFNGRRPGGYTMTYTTLASIVKYPFESTKANPKGFKYGFFQSEKDIFRQVAGDWESASSVTIRCNMYAIRWYTLSKPLTISVTRLWISKTHINYAYFLMTKPSLFWKAFMTKMKTKKI